MNESMNYYGLTRMERTMIKTFSVPMLDGFKSGIGGGGLKGLGTTELQTKLTEKEFKYMETVFLSYLDGASSATAVYALVRSGGSGTQASLTLKHWRGEYFFNVEGNPISFLTGQNLLGTLQLVKLITLFFSKIEEAIREKCSSFKLPASISLAIETLNIKVHSLAFACYTPELELKNWENISRVICAIDSIYSAYAALEKQSVKDLLGIRLVKEGEHSIRFNKFQNTTNLWSLAFYNKALELEETGKSNSTTPSWLRNRLRLDLTLSNTWFVRSRCSTLKDLKDRIVKAGGYEQWVYDLFDSCLHNLRLQYLLTFNLENVIVGKYEEEFNDWLVNKKRSYTEGCLEFFMEQGLDLTLGANLHEAVGDARAIFGLADGRDVKALLGDKEAKARKAKRFKDGLSNPKFLPVAARAHLLQPDRNFGRFTKETKVVRGEPVISWVDTTTGETLR